MANLNSSTLAAGVESGSLGSIRLASIANIAKGDLIAVVGTDGNVKEAMFVKATPITGTDFVRVTRGVAGTAATSHQIGLTVYTGSSAVFESKDPHGIPLAPPRMNPWINLKNGNVWFAEGESVGPDTGARYWQLLTPTYATGTFGIPSITLAPTS